MVDTVTDTVVLVEGESDLRAVEVVAELLGRDLSAIEVVSMAGITNLPARVVALPSCTRALVLYDGAEHRYVERVLTRPGLAGRAVELFACHDDLEDELVRALGVDRVVAVIEEEGELASLRLLQRQPAQRERTEVQHLRRFMSSHSGRKLRYAEALVRALEPGEVPAPLVALMDAVRDPG